MQIIKIAADDNGSHDNQTFHGVLPEGWAVIPESMGELENFPFGEVFAEEIDGVMTVTSWTPGKMPEPEPAPEPETEDDVWEQLDAAYQEGVNSVE